MNYILVDGLPVLEPDVLKWAQWYETARRTLARDELPDGVTVSTVFLGIDHSFVNGSPPVLWETMCFMDGELDEYQERYTNNADACRGHVRIVEMVRKHLDQLKEAT